MLNLGNKNIVKLTNAAISQLHKIMQYGMAEDALSCSVKIKAMRTKKSCLDMRYVIEHATEIKKSDILMQVPSSNKDMPDIRFIVDGESLIYLFGLVIDFETKGLNSRFVFHNPNANAHCGCGETFMHTSYFDLLDLKEQYDINLPELKNNFLKKKNTNDSDLLQIAYNILCSPLQRAKYMLKINGFSEQWIVSILSSDRVMVVDDLQNIVKEIDSLFISKSYNLIPLYFKQLESLDNL
ncbi:hypothetical protein CAXC1_330122 [Candidatus Xenohaliotis californiensis]|uniref:Core domain-containing protein n=1 Tax=Candidatus Xenohaliotis californiensis TaxID=84677 RepID=A0ABM9N8T8_9RICK|nr:hypothetical protein CAXC1_330122 [Candidatus Xenohaliotis californiensis]